MIDVTTAAVGRAYNEGTVMRNTGFLKYNSGFNDLDLSCQPPTYIGQPMIPAKARNVLLKVIDMVGGELAAGRALHHTFTLLA
jgi:hypothetical protein